MRMRGVHQQWSEGELMLLDRLKREGANLKDSLRYFPGRSLHSLYQKSRHRDKPVRNDEVIVDLTFDPKPAEKTVPSVYHYTRHSGKCFSDRITRERPTELGANVTAGLMGDPPVGQKLHGLQPGQSYHGESMHKSYRTWHL